MIRLKRHLISNTVGVIGILELLARYSTGHGRVQSFEHQVALVIVLLPKKQIRDVARDDQLQATQSKNHLGHVLKQSFDLSLFLLLANVLLSLVYPHIVRPKILVS